MLTPQEEAITGKWRAAGLLRDFDGRKAYMLAQVLENQANHMERDHTIDPKDEDTRAFYNIIFPVITWVLTSPLLAINWDVVKSPIDVVDIGFGKMKERWAVTQRLRTAFSIKRLEEIREKTYTNLDAEVEYGQELATSLIEEFNWRGKDLECTYFHTIIVGPHKLHMPKADDDGYVYGLMTRGIDVHKPLPGWRPEGYEPDK